MAKKAKSLSETNPYLRNPTTREAMAVRFVQSSSSLEGINVSAEDLAQKAPPARSKASSTTSDKRS